MVQLQPKTEVMPRVGFIMTTEVGLETQYLNWRHCLTPECGIRPEWIAIRYKGDIGVLEHLPLLPESVKERLRGQSEIWAGLAKGPYDALFIAGNMLHGMRHALSRQPYFITIDTTPIQLHAFGSFYGKQPTRFSLYERRKHLVRCERYQHAAALFPWSHWAAESMISDYGVDPSRIHIIPPGVDMTQWRCLERPAHSGPTRILFVGGQFYRKGGDLLLEWARTTSRQDWELHIVTRDPVSCDDARVIVHNNLAVNTPELRTLYGESDLFVLPTRADCYSLATIEAMASGLPVILGKIGGTGEIVRDEETGFLIGPGDADALTDRLNYMLDNPARRREMGCAARQDAESRYDAGHNIRRIVDIMQNIIGVGNCS